MIQVFQNLLGNADQISPKRIVTRRFESLPSRGRRDYVISVVDNGIGIDPQYTNQIFGIFKRLHGQAYSGAGMGLAIAKKSSSALEEKSGWNLNWEKARLSASQCRPAGDAVGLGAAHVVSGGSTVTSRLSGTISICFSHRRPSFPDISSPTPPTICRRPYPYRKRKPGDIRVSDRYFGGAVLWEKPHVGVGEIRSVMPVKHITF